VALLLGARDGDVLSRRVTEDLFDAVRESFALRAAFQTGGEERGLLRGLRDRLADEIDYEERFAGLFAATLRELEEVWFEDQLASLGRRFHDLAGDYFRRRASVVALHDVATTYYDLMLRKAIELAVAGLRMEDLGPPPLPFCWLVADSAGRLECTLGDSHQHFLVYAHTEQGADGYFETLGYRVTVLLKKAGLIAGTERSFIMNSFWRGSIDELRTWCRRELLDRRHEFHLSLPVLPGLSAPFRPLHREDEETCRVLERLADARPLWGDPGLAAEVDACFRETLGRLRESVLFSHVARQVAVMPLALGLFGGLKVERRGTHRGEIDIEQLALNPLVMNLCVLAVRRGVTATNTIERIRALLDLGELTVDLAQRLMRAYHEIMGHRIAGQLAGGGGKGIFLNPEALSEEDGQGLRVALESVASLQKYVHFCFAEHP
jgi:signal-transduction protein with cAMP-binding, CBS, and nucleotidyltransferase domain